MKTYYSTDFTGHYSVGTAAVVKAKNIEEATKLLTEELERCGLMFDGTLQELKSGAIVLDDGNY